VNISIGERPTAVPIFLYINDILVDSINDIQQLTIEDSNNYTDYQ